MSTPLERLRRGDLAGATSLDLSGCGLTRIPDEVLALGDTLERLDLGRNPIAALPHDFARLRRLRVLFGSGTRCRVLPPVLGACEALTQIGFRGAGVETVPAESLPPRLRWLTLTDNRIEALPAALGARPALTKLMLSGNRLSSLPDTFAGAASLELLRLSANRFEHLPGFLDDLPRLAWLAYAGNPAEPPPPSGRTAPVVPWASLTTGALLGEGASGRVHSVVWIRSPAASPIPAALKLYRGAMTSDGLPSREIDAALTVGAHPNLLGGLARIDDHPDGLAALLMQRLPPDWPILAGPPSLETCARDVYDPALVLPGGAALRIARAIAAAGAHLHACGLLHGDLYAHNIHWDGAGGEAVLGDFGAAARLPAGSAGARLAAFDVLAWGILASELRSRAPAGETSPALDAACQAATGPYPASRPTFTELVRWLPG